MNTKQEIEKILTEKFSPETLEIINESYKHAGHSGHDGTGESHFRVIISGKDIPGNNRIEKHRAVQNSLANIEKEIHSVSIELK